MPRRPSEARARSALFVLWCLGWVGVATLSLLPIATPIPMADGDKLLHALTYGGMTAAAVAFCRSPGRLALIALFAVALGGLVEIAQGLVAWRHASVLDAVANAVGAALGYLIGLLALAVLRRLPKDAPSPG